MREELLKIKQLCPWLKVAVIDYSGSGDDGNINLERLNESAIHEYSNSIFEPNFAHTVHNLSTVTTDDTNNASVGWSKLSKKERSEVDDAASELANAILDHNGSGNFNGEGGCSGTIFIDFVTGKYAVEDSQYYTMSNDYIHVGEITTAGGITTHESD